jgi:molybdopterin molybdotransferase
VITVAEASERILARFSALAGEPIATASAAGRVLSREVVAAVDSPPWNNSSMDGYALSSSDMEELPARLRVVEEIAAGSFPSRPIMRGEAMRVMTGAPVPEGADTVIRHEDTDDGREVVKIVNARDRLRNIRRKGEDFSAGSMIFDSGALLSIAHIGALAAAGIGEIYVHRRPRVAILSSGDELVELSEFDENVAGKKIVSANSITLAALVEHAGGIAIDLGISRDNPHDLRRRLESAKDVDLIITSAGISVGDHDYVRDVVLALGGSIDFWKVRMRPGAPLACGSIHGVPWIGLSGNPVSAIVTFHLFAEAAIRRMLGKTAIFRRTFPVRAGHSITLAAPLMHFLRVKVDPGEDGIPVARFAGSQSSGVLTAMARADSLLIIPQDRLEIAEGELHRAMPLSDVCELTDSLVLE